MLPPLCIFVMLSAGVNPCPKKPFYIAKRAARLEAKLQEEAKFNAPVPEIPDGSWRCMACGKILPDSIDRCECGYKK